MSKNLLVGVDGKARKAKELYIGVDGKARKIAKAYIGDENGKARLFWEKETTPITDSLEFVSDNSFTMSATKLWDGTIEYNNGNGWTTWNGSQISSGNIDGRQRIYFRGSRNTVIRGQNATETDSWKITGSNVECNGNIEYLLDYQKVAAGQHPEMGSRCYREMFTNCSSLITSPELPAITLANGCYQSMFRNCSSLTIAPELPATTLADYCYHNMFSGCSSLTTAPALPATTLKPSCYYNMFFGCSKLTTAPELPATNLAKSCYYQMFRNCSSLTTAPQLPATTLAENCYQYMFGNCSSLTEAPSLPATTLAVSCYREMFYGCEKLIIAPALPATTLAKNCYYYMFYGCFRLRKIPALPAHILPDFCYYGMFKECDIYLYSSGDETKNVIYLLPSEKHQWTNTQKESNSLTNMFTYDGLIQTPNFPAGYRLDNYYSIIS